MATVERELCVNALPEAAELVLHVFQGSKFKKYPVNIDTIFGTEKFKSERLGVAFAVSFRQAEVRLFFEDAEIAPSRKRYMRSVEKDQFLRFIKRELKKGKERTRGAIGSAKFDLSGVLKALGLSAEITAESSEVDFDEQIESLESSLVFNIVEPDTQKAWKIGHFVFGDPQREHGHLTSTYFEAPSDHYADSETETASALCDVQPIGKVKSYSISMALEVAPCGIDYQPIDVDEGWLDIHINKEVVEKIFMNKRLNEHVENLGMPTRPGRTCIGIGKIKLEKGSK